MFFMAHMDIESWGSDVASFGLFWISRSFVWEMKEDVHVRMNVSYTNTLSKLFSCVVVRLVINIPLRSAALPYRSLDS